MKTLLAVSPHLDDAVFSVGALLARRAGDGWRVVVATCFTASMPDPSGFALACQLDKGLGADVDYMALRRAEDVAACAVLGCEAVHLAFPEAPHRGYESAPALFGGRVPTDAVSLPLGEALATLLRTLDPNVVLGPAAIGGHIDHVIVRAIVERLRPDAALWADLPYAARAASAPQGFARADCARYFAVKAEASRCYASQLGFQFGSDSLENVLAIDGAEWLARGANESG